MDVEITRLSSKGQVVLPLRTRKRLNAKEGTLFAVVGTSDSVMLKKVSTPSRDELLDSIKSMAKEATHILKSEGMKEKDVVRTAVRSRGR